MRQVFLSTAVAAAIIVGANAHNSAAATLACVSATSPTAVQFREFLVALDTASVYTSLRQSSALPVISPGEITLVEDEALCQRAMQLHDSIYAIVPGVPLAEPVVLSRYGATRYAIYPPNHRAGEWALVMFTDTTFRFLNGVLH